MIQTPQPRVQSIFFLGHDMRFRLDLNAIEDYPTAVVESAMCLRCVPWSCNVRVCQISRGLQIAKRSCGGLRAPMS